MNIDGIFEITNILETKRFLLQIIKIKVENTNDYVKLDLKLFPN